MKITYIQRQHISVTHKYAHKSPIILNRTLNPISLHLLLQTSFFCKSPFCLIHSYCLEQVAPKLHENANILLRLMTVLALTSVECINLFHDDTVLRTVNCTGYTQAGISVKIKNKDRDLIHLIKK